MNRRDREPLTAEQGERAGAYLPLARSLATPFKLRWPALKEEFESEVALAVAQEAGRFEPGRGVKFATAARPRILGALKDACRRERPFGFREAPREGRPTIHHLDAHGLRYGRMVNRPEAGPPAGADLEAAEAFEALVRRLPARHAEVLRLIYRDGKDQRETARAIGLGQSRISNMHAEALAILRGAHDPT